VIVTIKSLSELTTDRKAQEQWFLAREATKLYQSREGNLTMRDAILMVMGKVRVSGTSEEIAQIELQAVRLR